MGKDKIYDMLKRIFRIQASFASVRSWSLNKGYPRKTNIHMFDLINKMRRKNDAAQSDSPFANAYFATIAHA